MASTHEVLHQEPRLAAVKVVKNLVTSCKFCPCIQLTSSQASKELYLHVSTTRDLVWSLHKTDREAMLLLNNASQLPTRRSSSQLQTRETIFFVFSLLAHWTTLPMSLCLPTDKTIAKFSASGNCRSLGCSHASESWWICKNGNSTTLRSQNLSLQCLIGRKWLAGKSHSDTVISFDTRESHNLLGENEVLWGQAARRLWRRFFTQLSQYDRPGGIIFTLHFQREIYWQVFSHKTSY